MLSRLRTFLAEMKDLEKCESSTFQLFLKKGKFSIQKCLYLHFYVNSYVGGEAGKLVEHFHLKNLIYLESIAYSRQINF